MHERGVMPHFGPVQCGDELVNRGGGDGYIGPGRSLDECRRAPIAQPEARRGHNIAPIPQVGQEVIAARLAAGNVIADMNDDRRSLLGRDQRIEGGNPECLCGRHHKTAAHFVESTWTNPSDLRLQSRQGWQQQVAKAPRLVTPADDPARNFNGLPGGNSAFDDLALSRCCLGGHESKIHSDPDPLATHDFRQLPLDLLQTHRGRLELGGA
jgi:hypothetical protein